MDLETFFTRLYVLVDDWYKAEGWILMQRHRGPALQLSDSEVLTIAIAGQWRAGVPWTSERSLVRYLLVHGRHWFPHMLERSAFNARVKQLWRALVCLQQRLADWMETGRSAYEVVDCLPLPACSVAQAATGKSHWLWWSQWGRGGNEGGWVFGEQLLMAVTQQGAITGWLLGPAQTDDRWLMQAFVSARAGDMQLVAPDKRPQNGHARSLLPPAGQVLPLLAVGQPTGEPYLADRGFNGARWQLHWLTFGARVITVPPANAPDAWSQPDSAWLSRHRQIIETTFAFLKDVFAIKHLQAHSRWGQLTRIAAKCAAFNFGLWLNHLLERPSHAFATLIL